MLSPEERKALKDVPSIGSMAKEPSPYDGTEDLVGLADVDFSELGNGLGKAGSMLKGFGSNLRRGFGTIKRDINRKMDERAVVKECERWREKKGFLAFLKMRENSLLESSNR